MSRIEDNEFFVTGGTLGYGARSYVERQADGALFRELLFGRFCYVLTSRQMGKSSLMVRTAAKLQAELVQVIVLDLTAIGLNLNPEQWFDGLCCRMGDQVQLADEVEACWQSNSRLSPVQRFFTVIGNVVLPKFDRVVIFIDEIDVVRSLPFVTDEFFAAIRACYNQRARNPLFERLAFCLLGVATPSDLISDTRTTPFNIGKRIELDDMSAGEASPLALGLRLEAVRGEALLQRVLYWTGGHPYLTQRLCQAVVERGQMRDVREVDEVCRDLFLGKHAMNKDDNLLFVRDRLLRSEGSPADVLGLLRRVLKRPQPVMESDSTNLAEILRLSGVIRVQDGFLVVRNRIYRRMFNEAWIDAHLPGAEKRRIRDAYIKGIVRATSVATVVLLLVGVLAILAFTSLKKARDATWRALLSQIESISLSSDAGRRFNGLKAVEQAASSRTSDRLREGAISCLLLSDLRESDDSTVYPTNTTALVFSPDSSHYAYSDSGGTIYLCGSRGRTFAVTNSSLPERLWIGPDNTTVAGYYPSGQNHLVRVWLASSQPRSVDVTNVVDEEAVAFGPDGEFIAIGNGAGEIRLIALSTGDDKRHFRLQGPCTLARFSPSGDRIALGSSTSLRMRIHDVSTGSELNFLHSASPPILMAWHPHGELLAAAGGDYRLRIWNVTGDAFPEAEFERHASLPVGLTFNHSGTLLASSTEAGRVTFWDPVRARSLVSETMARQVEQLQFSPDDRRLAYFVAENRIRFWEVAQGAESSTLFDFDARDASDIEFSPDGSLLALSHANGITLWNVAQNRKLDRIMVGPTTSAVFRPNSLELLTSGFRGLHLFRLEEIADSGLRISSVPGLYLPPSVSAPAFNAAGSCFAVGISNQVRIVSLTNSSYSTISEIRVEGEVSTLALAPDASKVAVSDWNSGAAWFWEVSTASLPYRLPDQGKALIEFSADGRFLGTGNERGGALWDTLSPSAQPRKEVKRIENHNRPTAIAFSSDGKFWAVAVSDSLVRVVDLRTMETTAEFESVKGDRLIGLRFSPDSARLAGVSENRTVQIWDLWSIYASLSDLGISWITAPTAPVPVTNDYSRLNVELGNLQIPPQKDVIELRREITRLRRKIEQEPDRDSFRWNLSRAYQKLGEYRRTVETYNSWIKAYPDNDWPLRDLAFFHLFGPLEFRDPSEAARLAHLAVEKGPRNKDNHYRFGVALYRTSDYENALSHLEIALEMRRASGRKNHVLILFYQAMTLAKVGRIAAAQEVLNEAIQAFHGTSDSYRKSHTEEFAGLHEEAVRTVHESQRDD